MSTRIKSQHYPQNMTKEQVARTVCAIALTQSALNASKAQMDSELVAVRKRYETAHANMEKSIEENLENLKAWANENKAEFGDRRSIEFENGTIGFRTGNPTLTQINRTYTWEKITADLLKHHPSYVRTKHEPNKELILADRVAFDLEAFGLKVKQSETFFIEPKLTVVELRTSTAA